MRFFMPELSLGVLGAPQTGPEDKLGGLPWGFPPESWPTCTMCKEPMTFLVELHHAPPRLDLGRDGRVLFVFMCHGGNCSPWTGGGGCNACFILEAPRIGTGPTETPTSTPSARVVSELRVLRWTEHDDEIPESALPDFYDEGRHLELDDSIIDAVCRATKLGSVPAWIQRADEGPPPPFRFVGQLSEHVTLSGPVPRADEGHCTISRRQEDGSYVHEKPSQRHRFAPRAIVVAKDGRGVVDWVNFAGSGRGYLFVDTSAPDPRAWFFFQS